MTDFTNGVPGKPVRPGRDKGRVVIMALCASLTLISVVCSCAVAVMAAVVLNQFGAAVDGVFSGLFHAFFANLAMFFMTAALFLFAVFLWIMELLALLSTGEFVLFFMRLVQFASG
jgi:hypothetical protein